MITSAPYRILIVDDEEIVMVALRETLARAGYQVATASNPLPALELLRKENFSVIITDQQMPMMTGLEFLAQVKQIQPDATRILITAVLSLDTVIDAINKGEIYRFIVKPWLREELLATVKNAVSRYELITRNALLQATTQEMNEKLKQLNNSLEEQVARVAQQNQQLGKLNLALEQNLGRSMDLCLHTMQTFYPTLGAKSKRVYQLCKAMADSLSLSGEDRQVLEVSALLHDIGLVGVPRQLIKAWQQDPASLNDAERTLIEHHPILGQELGRFVHHLEAVGTTIRAHHERFDGTGYPDRLTGESIPWLARLLGVTVSYCDSNLDPASSLEAIKQESGSAFDPDAVRALLRVLPRTSITRKEREVLMSELRPGMILAKGIYTASGMLLMPEGQELNAAYIDKLRNHNRINPISQSLVIYC